MSIRSALHRVTSAWALLAVACLICNTVQAQTGLVGWWKFDEGSGTTTADSSSYANTGTLVSSPTWISGFMGAGALTFNGTTNYVNIPNASGSLDNLQTTGMTVAAWVRVPNGVGGRIMEKGGWFFSIFSCSNQPCVRFTVQDTGGYRSSASSIAVNTWVHVAATWDGAGPGSGIHIFINGTLADSTTPNAGDGTAPQPDVGSASIGNRASDHARGLAGSIDDVRVFNRILSASEIVAIADSTSPSAPSGLSATGVSGAQINLSWTASTDNIGVTGYLIERCQGASCSNFTQVGTATGTTFSSTGLTASTSYTYRVRATDLAGNTSNYSTTVSATTSSGSDTTPPSAPSGLSATAASSTQINLSWTAATDNVGVTGYRVERCQGAGCSGFSEVGTPTGTTFSDTTVSASTSYSYRVRATDAATNLGGYSNTATATTPAAGAGIAFVQSKSNSPNNSSMTSISATFTSAQTTGNFNVVAIAWGPSSVPITSVTDTKGNTYALAVGPTASSGAAAAIYYAKNIAAAAAGANAVKVTFNAATAYPDIRIAEYSGINTTSPLDVTAVATGTGTLGDSGFATTTNPNDLLIGANWVSTGTNAAGANYTQREISSYDGDILEDRIVSATGAYNATAPVTPSGNWIMQMAAFKGVSSGLAAPTGLAATVVSSNQINLSWTASSGATKYLIERCASASCNYLQIDTSTTTSYSDTGLFPATGYTYRVRATNGGGSLSGYSNTSPASTQAAGPAHATIVNYTYDDLGRLTQVQYDSGGNYLYKYDAAGNRTQVRSSIDTAGPSVPTSLAGSAANANQINLTWTASTDTGGSQLQGYKVYRDATLIGTSPTNSYADTTVVGSRTYSYTVAAYDYAGNTSAQSTAASISTPDITPPSAPSGLSAPTVAYNQVSLSWSGSTDTGGSGLAGYRISRTPQGGSTTTFTTTSTSYTDTTVAAVTTYTYSVSAYDGAGNPSSPSNSVNVTTPSPPDSIPPSVPTGLGGSAVAWNQINLSWTASTDNVGVQGYKIYRNGGTTPIATSPTTSYSDTGLSDGTQYTYTVSAYDYRSNESGKSSAINVTTPIAVPSVPTGLSVDPHPLARGGNFSVSWSAVTGTPVTYYNLQEVAGDTNPVTTIYQVNVPSLSKSFSEGVNDENSYTYRVQACTARGSCSPFSDPKLTRTCPASFCFP